VLAGIHQQCRVTVTETSDNAAQRVGTMSIDGLGDQPDDVRRIARPRKLDQPRAVHNFALEGAERLEGRRVWPTGEPTFG
jgi:hypothetical protein